MMAELNPKQKMFCQEYLVDLNATQAAIRAGYSKKTAGAIASEYLQKPNLQEYIKQLIDERSKRVEISAEAVLEDIVEIKQRCMQKVQVRDKDGNPTGEWVFKEQGALKANELLGKHLKMFVEKKEVEHTGTIQHNVTQIDLDERIKKGKK